MTEVLVIDSSVALGWSYVDERGDFALGIQRAVARNGALVPSHWHLEIGNSLVGNEGGGRLLLPADTAAILADLGELDIETDTQTSRRAFRDTAHLARKHGLTSYDAAYLELALRKGALLATLDRDLRDAAAAEGAAMLEAAV